MTISTIRFLLVWALCLFGGGYALAAPVAYVHALTGNMRLEDGTRAPQGLKIGDTVDSGATLITEAGSNAVVKFEDGQLVALQPDTRFAVRQYEFVKTNVATSNSVLELLAGGLRFVTGMIGATNRIAFKLTAGTATFGIRGTDGTVIYEAIANVASAATNLGALAIITPLGTSDIPAGNFVTARPNVAPPPAAPIAQAPPTLLQAITQARAVTMPANTAVSVIASARAAGSEARAAAAERAVQIATTEAARQAAQPAADEARAAAIADARAAAEAGEQTTEEAVRGGAVLPAAPAPPIAPPAAEPGLGAAPASTGGGGVGGFGTGMGAGPMSPGAVPMSPGAGPLSPGAGPMSPGAGPMRPGAGQMSPGGSRP